MDNIDIFSYMNEQQGEKESPLAARMRPETLDEVVGQEHILGPDKLLTRAIKADRLSSVIFEFCDLLRASGHRKDNTG